MLYTHQLSAVLPAGGWVHLLEISEQVTEHPSTTQAEIVDTFDGKWAVPRICPATYVITTGEVPAWLASVQHR